MGHFRQGPLAQYARVAQRDGTMGLSARPAQVLSSAHHLCPYHLARTRGGSAPLSRTACPTGPFAGSGLLRAQPSSVWSSCRWDLCAKSCKLDETAPWCGKGHTEDLKGIDVAVDVACRAGLLHLRSERIFRRRL